MADAFFEHGWAAFPVDSAILDWLDTAEEAARRAVADPAHSQWHRCGGTWFAGVNALDNDVTGTVAGGLPLQGAAIRFAEKLVAERFDWDRAQVSVCYPGYPKQGDGESDAAFAYRRDRDAAHVDGLLPVGPARRRFLREHHRFILGLPTGPADAAASPLVMWEGSHRIVRETFAGTFGDTSPATWRDVDVTEVYHADPTAHFCGMPARDRHRRKGRGLSGAPAGPARHRALGRRRDGRGADGDLFPPRIGRPRRLAACAVGQPPFDTPRIESGATQGEGEVLKYSPSFQYSPHPE